MLNRKYQNFLESEFLQVDGSKQSGSGTILRLSIALAGILNRPLYLYNIRKNRPKPGLKPQHLHAVLTAAKLCNAELKGAKLSSSELWFSPSQIRGGKFKEKIGTAGSIPLLVLTVLPLCLSSKEVVSLHITHGGTDVKFSPTVNYIKWVFLEVLRKMGAKVDLKILKYGYYPKGLGETILSSVPCEQFKPICLEEFGHVQKINGISVCTALSDREVAERQAKTATAYLRRKGFESKIQIINDNSNSTQKGSSLVLWAKTDTGVILGADAIGEMGKRSEVVGKEAAFKLIQEIRSQPTIDKHSADMIIPYLSLTDGKTVFFTTENSEHLRTNIWLVERILKVKFKVNRVKKLYKIEKMG